MNSGYDQCGFRGQALPGKGRGAGLAEKPEEESLRRHLWFAALAMAVAVPAGATPVTSLTLTAVTSAPYYQQTTNNPCVIGDNSCSGPAGWTWTVLPANPPGDAYNNITSPVYTVGQITTLMGGPAFMIGVDINQANKVQTLGYFGILVDGITVAEFAPGSPVPVPPTTGGGNGNGYADYLLTGFSLAGYDSASTVQFTVTMPYVNDGREQFFLVRDSTTEPPPQIPEPATSALIGGGLLGLGLLSRRYRKRS